MRISTASVLDILRGRTQMRLLVSMKHPMTYLGGAGEEGNPAEWGWFFDGPDHHGYMVLARGLNERFNHGCVSIRCPHGDPGDRMWVKETWAHDADDIESCRAANEDALGAPNHLYYKATEVSPEALHWRSAITMPRWASRLTLEITEVRVQRLHEITEDDARAEGVKPFFARFPALGREQHITSGELARDAEHRASYAVTWDEANGKRAMWATNPWVWALTFRRISDG